jgi:hypothetical protein
MDYITQIYNGDRYNKSIEEQLLKSCLKNWQEFRRIASRKDIFGISKIVKDVRMQL